MGLFGVIIANLFGLSIAVTALSFLADLKSGEPSSGEVHYYGALSTAVTFVLLILANYFGW